SLQPRRRFRAKRNLAAHLAHAAGRMAAPLSLGAHRLRHGEISMRVIAGTYRSRILKSLKGFALRPTSDRLRETLFNVLTPNISGARFADLFAGTGAIGIEALSRGAAEVVFIENHAPAATLIRRNLESLGINTGVTVLAVDALRGIAMLASRKHHSAPSFDHVFLDPPYSAAEDC